ncbi:MAG: threonine ammonia-lyase [Syntrophobacteraceae bacterium]
MIPLKNIEAAAQVIRGKIIRTPLIHSPTFSKMSGAQVFLKLENLQSTGSFKLRGASFKILSHLDEIGPGGVVAASAGNHAQGVALAAQRAGLRSTILMPESVSISKQQATLGYGGEVILEGVSIGESIGKARELAEAGKTFIHPYDDLDIITGQATIALEIFEDVPDPDLILVPVGGGGLISGIASAFRALRPKTRIVGVQAAACPSAYESRSAGKVVGVEAGKSIADGIAVKQVGDITFSIINELVDQIVLVEEDDISAAILMLLERKRILAEGAGAVPLAELINPSIEIPRGGKVVLVISGGNVDTPLLDRVLRRGLFKNGRIMRFSVFLDDVPGTLSRLLAIIARKKANVLHIYHDRSGGDLPVHLTRVDLELETRGSGHIEEITEELQSSGYRMKPDSSCSFPL